MVSNPTKGKLEALKEIHPQINITTNNCDAAKWADVVILAVKPWIMQTVVKEIKNSLCPERQQLVSIAAGVKTAEILSWLGGISMLFIILSPTLP